MEGVQSQKGIFSLENETISKRSAEQTIQTSSRAESAMSRRQFSAGLPGMLLVGTIVELPEHNIVSALASNTSTLPSQPGLQKLTPHASTPPQYVLSDTTASVWSPDSQHIATIEENVVTLYNANTGKSELTYYKHTDEILTVKWSADSKYLASSGFDHIVHVWDAVLGQTVTTYEGHTDIVRDVAWSPNQHYLVSAGYDKTVQVWEALTGTTIVKCSGHEAEIQTLTWSPDSRFIASTDLQNKTMIWRVA